MNVDRVATRVAYGEALREFGGDERIVVLDADLAECTMSGYFAEAYPERFINLGIAEANMIGVAAGVASTGRIAFCHSFAVFTAGRGFDQIRNSVAYPRLNVKIIGSHAGVTIGPDGATHQALEDFSCMRAVPNMVVLSPCDARETREAVRAMIAYDGPCYLRTSRYHSARVMDDVGGYRFDIGKGVVVREGTDVTLVATGTMAEIALEACRRLNTEGVSTRLINMHTIKPIDRTLILDSIRATGAIVTCEEHNILGGLGSAVAEVVCEECPAPVMRVGVNDVFGRSGSAEELLAHFGLTAEHIVEAALAAIDKKR